MDAWEKSIVIMAMRAAETARYANGQKVEVTKKVKEIHFNQVELEAYIRARLQLQENRCALPGIPLQPYGRATDQALLPSLDRIDSDGHYSKDNLQVVCRFVNNWKSSTAAEEFRRLLTLVREEHTPAKDVPSALNRENRAPSAAHGTSSSSVGAAVGAVT